MLSHEVYEERYGPVALVYPNRTKAQMQKAVDADIQEALRRIVPPAPPRIGRSPWKLHDGRGSDQMMGRRYRLVRGNLFKNLSDVFSHSSTRTKLTTD